MEDEKKKKKNRKKKNKQNKTADNIISESVSKDISIAENHITMNGVDTATNDSEAAEIEDDPVFNVRGDQDTGLYPEITAVAEVEKQQWKEREASLVSRLKLCEEEKGLCLEKESSLLEQIEHLQHERETYIHKAAVLEEQILQLQKEKDVNMQKEVSLERELAQLQLEKEAHVQREVHLETKVKQMEEEIESWVQKENSNKEVIASLSGDISRLQVQVASLEKLTDSQLQENQLLVDNVSGLQMQILNLESSAALVSSSESEKHTVDNGYVTPQIGATSVLADKLIAENAELVDKVNALHAELKYNSHQNQESLANGSSGIVESAGVSVDSDVALLLHAGAIENPEIAPAADLPNGDGKKMFLSDEIMDVGGHDGEGMREHGEIFNPRNISVTEKSLDMSESDEIVQISLDETERPVIDPVPVHDEDKSEVPISDAPLIGAPFRIISFVARYVSGADLVEKKKTRVTTGG